MTLLALSILIGLVFTLMSHPLAMGLTLLFQTLVVALLSGLTASSFWFSYILFLVFLGGMLVLFIYVTSLASNELFSSSSLLWVLSGSAFTAIILAALLIDSHLISFPLTNLLQMSMGSPSEYLSLSLLKLYSSPSYGVTLLLVVYLFLTLVAVVNITKIFKGPLRPQN